MSEEHGHNGHAGASRGAEHVSLSGLKGLAPELNTAPAQYKNYQVMPMFLPTDVSSKKGEGVIKVVTRQKFLDNTIYQWVMMNTTIAVAGILGLVALLLIPVNLYLAAAAGLGAGYAYGRHMELDFRVNKELKHRWLLEGT